MKKHFILLLLCLSSALLAQQTNYQEGIFILNEDWFGHNNSTINFVNNSGEIYYRAYEYENQGKDMSLGCTSQYGMIYGGKLMVISKQGKDDGDSREGGRIIVANATDLQNISASQYIATADNGKSIADGRTCVGINEKTAYIGTSNGIYKYDLEANQILDRINGTANPLVAGTENNADGQGALYNNQIGHIRRTADYVFAVYQDSGIFVIDPHKDEIISVIEGCFSSMVQSKDGSIWAARNTNLDAQKYPYGGSSYSSWGDGWQGNQIVRINPFSLDTTHINIPEDFPGIRQTWYAWTNGGFCASYNSNNLYWTDDNGWFESSKIYQYNIDDETFKLVFDAKDIHPDRNIYGAGFGINPLDDHLFVFGFNNFSDNRYWIYELNKDGELQNSYSLIQNFWFPSMVIPADKYAPELIEIPDTIKLEDKDYKLYLGDLATDQDNLDAAIVKTVESIADTSIANFSIRHDTLTISSKGGKDTGTSFTLAFYSNGKKISKEIYAEMLSTTALPAYKSGNCNIYPNPAQHHFTVSCDFAIERISIYSSLGVQIKTIDGEQLHSLSIDISDLKVAYYFISIEGKYQRITKKINKNN